MTLRHPFRSQPRTFAPVRPFFTEVRAAMLAGAAVAVLLSAPAGVRAQNASDSSAMPATSAPQTQSAPDPAAASTNSQAKPDISLSNPKPGKTRKEKEEKVVQSKDTKKSIKKTEKVNKLEGVDVRLPDKTLYDKAEDAIKHGRYDVGRLDLQTLLNTYPDSQFQMRAKLAIADSWYKEGGTAALTQAEQEYHDFITFFPNAPEAAEAQMRVGDIYFRQMDKPDRDYTKTVNAEHEYRLMLQQFPDSPLVPQAQQRLREVQETLASRDADIAAFYATHSNYAATIARYQTVVDTYPLYSHMDDVLVALGDAYEGEARFVRTLKLPESGKARLLKIYEDQAAAAWNKVVLEHSAAPHVEDARDRLVALGRPVPTPTAQQVAASTALENSRGQYTLSKRAIGFIMHKADTVAAATTGEPPLENAKPTLAPTVVRETVANFNNSLGPDQPRPNGQPIPANAEAAPTASTPAPAAAPLAFQNVPAANAAPATGAVINAAPAGSVASPAGGTSMGIELVNPPAGSTTPATAPATPPAFPGSETPAALPAAKPEANGGIGPVGPPNATPLPAVEKAAAAPDPVNEVTPGSQPPAQAAPANGKKPKVAIDKSSESSSKHKPKKGLGKLNPF